MKLSGRNLSVQMQGEDVNLLQHELHQLGFQIPPEETNNNYFGAETRRAVLRFQKRHDVPTTGAVDEETARLINEAVDARQDQFVVRGSVHTENGEPVAGIVVRAFDKDLVREEPLGEAITDKEGLYDIPYIAEQFTRAEKTNADLVLRAYRQQRLVFTHPDRGALYNSLQEVNVDLTIPAPPELSEHEVIDAELRPLMDDLHPWELSEDRVTHLEHEFEDDDLVTPRRVRLFAQDARLAQETGLPVAFFYGVARVRDLEAPLILETFLASETAELLAQTKKAIEGRIAPAWLEDELNRIGALLDRLRLERGHLVRRTFKGRLVKIGTDGPLMGLSVRATHERENEERDLGLDTTGREGLVSFIYLVPRDASTLGRLHITVLDDEDRAIFETEIEVSAEQDEVVPIEVPADVLPHSPAKSLRQLKRDFDLQVPDEVLDALEERGVASLKDIRLAGGVERLDDVPDNVDPKTIALLNTHARLDSISTNSRVNAALIEKGYSSPLRIANTPLPTLVADLVDVASTEDVLRLGITARAEVKILNNIGAQARKLVSTGADDSTGFVKSMHSMAAEVPEEECHCEDCDAAVSPRAYLVDLIKYVLDNVRTRSAFNPSGESVGLDFLTSTFHQPISDFADDCSAAKKELRQVRLCVEVLRAELGGRPRSDVEVEARLRRAERQYRLKAYGALLTGLGSSLQEVRAASSAEQEERIAIAERLGISIPPERPAPPGLDQLDRLYLDPGTDPEDRSAVSEAALEHLFGLVNTNRDVLSTTSTVGDDDQLRRIELEGVTWKKNTDDEGLIYASLSYSGGQTQLSLYKDAERSKPVATGDITAREGEILLAESNGSGLSGRVFVRHTSDSIATLSALPRFLSWRMQRLRDLWNSLDWPSDAYSESRLPVIDPDLIGPDDFRHPEAGNVAFDLWRSRRGWVDAELEALNVDGLQRDAVGPDGPITIPDFQALVKHMYTEPVRYEGGDYGAAWDRATPIDGFTALRRTLIEGSKEDVETATEELEENLRLSAESFFRLLEIRDKDQLARQDSRAEQVSDDEWHEAHSILVQARKRHLTRVWIEEEDDRSIVLDPKTFWLAIHEPVVDAWHRGLEAERPLIDPELVGRRDLPDPTAGRAARALWENRRTELDSDLADLQQLREEAATVEDGLAAMLDHAFDGLTVDLAALHADLNSNDDVAVAGAEQRIRDDLFLTIEAFRRLVTLKQKNDDGTVPLSTAEWHEVRTILVGVYKGRVRYPVWVEEEQDRSLTYWQALKARLPEWRASGETRQSWLQALKSRTQAPLIDPDLIDRRHLAATYRGEGEAHAIWEKRYDRLEDELRRLRADREAPGSDSVTWFRNALRAILDIADPIDLFDELRQAEEDGERITARLEQFNLSRSAYLYLQHIVQLLKVDPAATLLETEWEDVYNLLIQVWKERRYGEWRSEERGRISLSPDRFKLPERKPFTFPPEAPTPPQRWRASDRAVREWEDALEARMEQEQTVTEGLRDVVSTAEEETLPLLRDALIRAIDRTNTPFMEKAKALSERLLIDTQESGCRLTTRVGQAIETLQELLWSHRTGQLSPYYGNLRPLQRGEFDEEWRWIGSYATWRAASFVFLYPENISLPSLRRRQTPAFRELVSETRANRSLTPERACAAAARYAAYLRDVANLRVGSTCEAKTFLRDGDCTGSTATAAVKPSLLHLFAQSEATGNLYWSTHTGHDADYAHSFWQALPQFEDVVDIIGAVPYEVEANRRYIYLFVRTQAGNEQKLEFDRFNLETGRWENQKNELDIPEDATVFTAVIKQTVSADKPPSLGIRPARGAIYVLDMNLDGTDWAEVEDLLPIAQPLIVREGAEVKTRYLLRKLLAMIEISTGEFYVIGRGSDGWIHYRLFGERDDGEWQGVIDGEYGSSTYCGGFALDEKVYVFTNSDGVCARYTISAKPMLSWPAFRDIDALEWWLNSHAGVSLREPDMELLNPLRGGVLGFADLSKIDKFIDDDSVRGIRWRRANKMVEAHIGGEATLKQAVITASGTLRQRILYHQRVSKSDKEWTRTIERFWGDVDEMAKASVAGRPSSGRFQIVYQLSTRLREPLHTSVTLERDSNRFRPSLPRRLAPIHSAPFSIPERLIGPEFAARKSAIESVFNQNVNEPLSTRTYLEEAYHFVPIHLALQLQQHGHYVQALDWFRTVYNYGSAPDTLEDRRIYPYLQRDGLLPEEYTRLNNWLLDPLDVHEIARSRPGAYTRFTLMALVRCLLAYGDAEFTQDTSESVTRARELYTTALDLLRLPELQQSSGACQDIVAWLVSEIDAVMSGEAPALVGAWEEVAISLHGISAPETVARLSDTILKEALGDGAVGERLERAEEAVLKERERTASPRRISDLIAEANNATESLHTALLTLPAVVETTESASRATGDRVLFRDGESGDGHALISGEHPGSDYSPSLSFAFCVPENPVLDALRLHAELNLHKIRTCRNIAGLERQLDPYAAPTDATTGLPQIGVGGNLVLPGTMNYQPTPYRFPVLIERSKQLAQFASQTEAALFAAIEKGAAEFYNQLTARQQVSLSRAGLRLQDLRIREARNGIGLAELQQERAQIHFDHFDTLLDEGVSELETASLALMVFAAASHASAAVLGALPFAGGSYVQALSSVAATASTTASLLSQWASYERRKQDWAFQRTVASQDIRIGAQQVKLAEDRLRIVGQERKIAEIQTDHAKEVVDYLANKFTNVELYDWMSDVLEGVYSFFLQQATGVAKVAEYQLAFERQEAPPAIIQEDYWETPSDSFGGIGEGDAPDRRGLTGSARLLQDIVRLDQHAFDTNRRKLELSKTISLSRLAPGEFQRFRETGVMRFDTPMELFNRDFPGHYLRLIRRVRTTVVALVPSVDGIHATLTTTGLSRVVVGGDLFQTVPIRRSPESVALTSPRDASGLFELSPQPQEMLFPFESMGVDTSWELRMPKASNQFSFDTIADVLVTIEYTALSDYGHEQQVLHERDQSFRADRPFSFRHEFADQWYDLNNSQLTAEPMVVRFTTRREDFLPNLNEIRIEHVMLYIVTTEDVTFEVPNVRLAFKATDDPAPAGGEATSVEGVISTRRSNGGSWLAMIGKSPVGEWELALPSIAEMRERLEREEIKDLLLVISYVGRTPAWPE